MSHLEHEWTREQIAAHLAGGLSVEERARLEAHIASCAECIAEIDAARRFEKGIDEAFLPVRPEGLEDRVIRALRETPGRRSWGLFGKFLAAAAAAGLLGAVGYAILDLESPRGYGDEVAVMEPTVGWAWSKPSPSRRPVPSAPAPEFRGRQLEQLRRLQEGEVEELALQRDAREADHNETVDDEAFNKAKGDSSDYLTDRALGRTEATKKVGGMGGKGRVDGPGQAPATEAPVLAFAAGEKQQQLGAQNFYRYKDAAPEAPQDKAGYFKPSEALAKAPPAPPPAKPPPARENRRQESGNAAEAKGELKAAGQADPAPQPVRKIIRSGEVEFEVEGFDSSVAKIQQIAGEEGGFIATVNSEKLANGKVRGSVVVRVAPDRLDTLLLKLRAMGDLKSQRIGSQDVTKAYYDSESRLRAARAMEERLLRIIKEGKGEIKDLLLAEKELGEWRTKIEQSEGEIRYYNSLISLSTLTITLQEKEIRAASGVVRTERVDMAVEVEDVEKSHRDALSAIAEAKGRVTRSELKQHAAGQYNSLIHFEVASTASGPLRDRLRQLGVPARMDVNVLEENEGGPVRAGSEIRVTQKDSQFTVSIYNLANVAPRETTHVNLACLDAEKAYKDILARAEKAGGRIVTSQLNRQRNDQTTGTIHFEVKSAEAEAVLLDVLSAGEVMRRTSTENPDAQNVTRSKRGFQVQVFALGTIAPRETVSVHVAARDMVGAFKALAEAAKKAGARILVFNEGARRNANPQLEIEVMREQEGAVEAALRAAGEPVYRTSNRSGDTENVVDSKIAFKIMMFDLGALAARETTKLSLAAKEVGTSYKALVEAARKADAWVKVSNLSELDPRNMRATLQLELRRDQEAAFELALKGAGTVHTRMVQRAPESSGAVDSKVRFDVDIFDRGVIDPRETHTVGVEVGQVDGASTLIEKIAAEGRGSVEDVNHSRDSRSGRQVSTFTLRMPLSEAGATLERLKTLGSVKEISGSKNPSVPLNDAAVARFVVTLSNDLILSPDAGPWANIKRGLGVSLTALSYALMLIMIGLCFVTPVALLAWGGLKIYRKTKAKPA